MRSVDCRSACTSTSMSLEPERSRPAGILVSALAIALATRDAFMPLVTSLKGSTATRISSSASPQVSAISVPGVLARLIRNDSATRDKMPICGSDGCCQLIATMIVDAMG